MDDVLLFANTMQEIKDMLLLGFLFKSQGIYLSQKKKKRLKKRIKEYRYKLESGEWDEAEYALHITPVLAHVAISRGRRYCNRIL